MFVKKHRILRSTGGDINFRERDCVSPVRDCLKRGGHGATAPKRESRLQPGCGRNRLTPGRLGRCPVSQGTPHAVGPTRIIFSDSL